VERGWIRIAAAVLAGLALAAAVAAAPGDCGADGDGDGVGDLCDNCPGTPNAAQEDTDPCDCCAGRGDRGCPEPTCAGPVCAVDPYCCSVVWDAGCGSLAAALCACCAGDGYGDPCECPDPASGPPLLGPVVAASPTQFVWPNLLPYLHVRGDFVQSADVGAYAYDVFGGSAGTTLVDLQFPVPGAGFWYLLKPDCPGTGWGEPEARDAVLPP